MLKRVHLTISGCLGPGDLPNVVAIVMQEKTARLGNITLREQYQSLLDWACRSKDSGYALELPRELTTHLLEDPTAASCKEVTPLVVNRHPGARSSHQPR